MKTVRLGLIGAGSIARLHLDAIKGVEGLTAVGLMSRSLPQAKELAGEYGIPVCEDNLETMVRVAKPDALMVMVSIDQMFAVTKAALAFGLPLFVEKPAGISVAENKALVELAQAKKLPTLVGFNRRYYSIFHQGLEVVKRHGRLLGVLVEGHERMPQVRAMNRFSPLALDEWLYANSIHTIDLLRFFGGEPSQLKTICHSLLEKRGDQFGAIMELERGGIGQYISHWYSPGGWRVVLYGQGVTVEFKPLEKGWWVDSDYQTHELVPEPQDVTYKAGFYRQMEALRDMVLSGKTRWPDQDLEGSLKTMQLAERLTDEMQAVARA